MGRYFIKSESLKQSSKPKPSKYNKITCFVSIEFTTKELFTKNTNITAKLKRKLFTKVISAKQRSLGLLQTESLMQRSASAFNLERTVESLMKRVKHQALQFRESRECSLRSKY